MNKTYSNRRSHGALKKFLAIATTGAIAAVPFLGSISIGEAKPPSHAPAHGYRNKQNKDKHKRNDRRDRRDYRRDRRDDDRYDRNRNDRNRYDRNRNDRNRDDRNRTDRDRYDRNTVSGIVTDVKSDQRFSVRTNGRTYEVYSPSRLPRDLNRGDYVRVYGTIRGDRIDNANVAITSNR